MLGTQQWPRSRLRWRFSGVRRRQDVLHQSEGWTVLEDFAHHPTAIAGALEGLRAAYPNRALIVSFEPRSNTARTAVFQDAFTQALAAADQVYLGAVHRADTMAAATRLNTQQMVDVLGKKGAPAQAFDSNEALFQQLERDHSQRSPGAVYIFFTNGAFDRVPQRIAALIAGGCDG
jgi:UDP-N-acetylmuramate: L-alanyl-gamma-D-glutamyl-meso-diaminopimelate ligase